MCYVESIRLYLDSEMSPQEFPKLVGEIGIQLTTVPSRKNGLMQAGVDTMRSGNLERGGMIRLTWGGWNLLRSS